MKTKNLTPFPFGTKVTSRRPPRPEMTLILRAAFLLEPGKPLALPPGTKLMSQGPMTAEVYREEDEERAGELLYPGDFADYKPRAEVMLRGTCFTPEERPLTVCPVRFSVGGWSKILRVVGRRFWSDDRAGAVMSEPMPFTSMPVDYAHAFGGPGHAPNPVGKGYRARELPSVEHAGAIIRSRKDEPAPAGFGPLSPTWPQRTAKLGKEYGKSYRDERAPYYAADFDWTYFNAAPLDQQLEGYLRGDEELTFQNLHRTAQVFSTRLPGLRIRAFVKDDTGRFREVRMNLDTVFADLDQGKLWLVWRGLDAIKTDDKKDVQTVLVASEPLAAAPLSEAHYLGLLEAFEADPLEIKARMPADVLEAYEDLKTRKQGQGQAPPPAAFEPPPDPLSAMLQKQIGTLPSALPGQDGLQKSIASAISRMMAAAPPGVDMKGLLGKAVNDAAAKGPPPALPRRPGGPAPAWALDALRTAKEKTAALEKAASEKGMVVQGADKFDELARSPFLAGASEPKPPQEPGPGRDLSGQDFQGRDLHGADLRGANLSDANLDGANLSGANLTGANLENAVLAGADLTGADFTGANLTLANLTAARAPGAIFREATLDRTFLEKANLRMAALAGARGEAAYLPEADLTGADAAGLSLKRAFARGATLADANFSGATLVRCLFLSVNARGVDLSRATLTQTSFAKSDLKGAKLVEARGDRTIWLGATLRDADFGSAVLPNAHFMDAQASRANFRRAMLKEARCYRASLEYADLTEANLFAADFTKCALGHAKFTGANLFDAKFRDAAGAGCNFDGANLKRSTLEKA
jgi:uncharacterized protein YjbI with pentapeptide repeats